MFRAGLGLKTALALAAASGLAAALAGLVVFEKRLHRPFKGYADPTRIVLIPKGLTVGRIGKTLSDNGVIESPRLFHWHLRLKGDFPLQAGEYLFDRPLSIPQVAEKLRRGQVHQRKITVPEGYDAREVSALLAKSGFGRLEEFHRAAADPSPVSDLDPDARDLEGYLFPETYFFSRETSEREIVSAMVKHFRRVWTPQWNRRAQDLGMTVREVVTLASLIEKEAALASERPLVSTVFHNRLRLNMNLACDPTVVYAVKLVKEYDGVINQSDLNLDSPYNTYRYPGLPPGPIANPGKASIEAALYPADADFLYFVSRNDGSHVFSKNYRDHHRAVMQYQR